MKGAWVWQDAMKGAWVWQDAVRVRGYGRMPYPPTDVVKIF
ncbi:hypothetical protein [Leyella stercorea]|nr:hypothetical protein [Leyella stercorea]